MAEAVAALERVAGDRPRGQISFEIDAQIQAIVDGWPRETQSARAQALGFQPDASMDDVIRAYIEDEL
jgi:nucleoside-diphosphate-sugar epimerase